MEKFNSKCVQYEGECLEQIEVCKGEDLEKIIINLLLCITIKLH